jgi:hypothetical protein
VVSFQKKRPEVAVELLYADVREPARFLEQLTMTTANGSSPETLEKRQGVQSQSTIQPSGDPSAVAPPVPIPNTEVKRCSPDDSTSIGCAKVGRRQSYAPFLAKAGNGALVFTPITPHRLPAPAAHGQRPYRVYRQFVTRAFRALLPASRL